MKNTAKKVAEWKAAPSANQNETITGARIGWRKISDDKGRGVFALQNFKKGEVVEVAPVIPVSKKAIDADHGAPDGYLLDWDGNFEDEEYCMPLGYVMLYNHSDDPNLHIDQDFDAETMTVTALRDIKKGEELCWNYNCEIWFDLED